MSVPGVTHGCVALPHVSVEHPARYSQDRAGYMGPDTLANFSSPGLRSIADMSHGITEVSQACASRAPPIFEGYQASVFTITPAHVKFGKVIVLGLLYRMPEQELHPPQAIEMMIGATILVYKPVLVTQGDNTGNWAPILRRHSDLNVVAKTGN